MFSLVELRALARDQIILHIHDDKMQYLLFSVCRITTYIKKSNSTVNSSIALIVRTEYMIYIFKKNSGERLNRQYTKFDFAVDEGTERLMKPSREKNKGMYRRRKVDEKSCVTFLLCDPGWYVHKPDVQNNWEENTHTSTAIFCNNTRHFNINISSHPWEIIPV